MLSAFSARLARFLRRIEPRQSLSVNTAGSTTLYSPTGDGSFVALSGGGIRFGSLQLSAELREQVFKTFERLPDGVGLVVDRSIAEVHAFHLPQRVRDDLIEQIDDIRLRREATKKLGDRVVEAMGDGHQAVDVSGGLFVGQHAVLLMFGGDAALDDSAERHLDPAASSQPAPSTVGLGDGIPSADAPPPASAEPLSTSLRIKVCAVRLAIMAQVGIGFGAVFGLVSLSLAGFGVGFLVGAVLSAKRALRIGPEDIRF